MSILTNKDMEIMIEVEELLHKKLLETNAIKEIDENGEEYYYFDENDKENEIWTKYWNLVERLIINKKNRTNIVNQRNKIEYLFNKSGKGQQTITPKIGESYQPKEYTRPMYLVNKDNELGLVLGIRKY